MSNLVLALVRDRLKDSTLLSDYTQTHYQKPLKFFIGYKKNPSAHEYPFLSCVTTRSIRKKGKLSELNISLVLGVNESEITGDVFDGVARLDEMEELIMSALTPFRLDATFSLSPGDVRSISDLGIQHPYHKRELQMLIVRRRS